jgi:hypothetical protein
MFKFPDNRLIGKVTARHKEVADIPTIRQGMLFYAWREQSAIVIPCESLAAHQNAVPLQ